MHDYWACQDIEDVKGQNGKEINIEMQQNEERTNKEQYKRRNDIRKKTNMDRKRNEDNKMKMRKKGEKDVGR
jgi:hypothetical protein